MPITLHPDFPAASVEDLDGRGFRIDDQGNWTADRVWNLVLDLSAATAPEVAAIERHVEALVPVARYDAHPARDSAYARTCEVRPNGATDNWRVTVGYSSAPLGSSAGATISALPANAGTNAAKPTKNQDKQTPANQRYPEVWFDGHKLREILEQDVVTGAAVQNAAGDPYDPPAEVDRTKAVIRLRKWKPTASFPLDTYLNYNDAVNDAPVTVLGQSFATGTLRVLSCFPKLVWDKVDYGGGETVTAVWEVEAAVLYDSRGHKVKLLNAGKRQRVGGAGEAVQITDKGGTPVADPVPLAANGSVLAVGGTRVYQDWNGYVPQPFTTLLG